MGSIGTGYDLSASTYSPDGRIFQVEYALKAVENSGTCIGIKTIDGVVLAHEKLVQSKLLVPQSNNRIQTIDMHIGFVAAGLLADSRHLAKRAREEAENYRSTYRKPIPSTMIAKRISGYVSAFTLYSSVRPFGLSTIVASVDVHGPALYMIEPSGLYYGYNATAVGKGSQLAKTELEKLDFKTLTAAEAVKHAARIIHMVHDESKDKDFELELTWISPQSNGKHAVVPKDIKDEAERLAKAALDDEMDED
ncbi:nucleophile aminohydrolase [Globomyces pollinis-pini]|nr:nucleophile aminohydrolase [Globomyces pollinis-pini]